MQTLNTDYRLMQLEEMIISAASKATSCGAAAQAAQKIEILGNGFN